MGEQGSAPPCPRPFSVFSAVSSSYADVLLERRQDLALEDPPPPPPPPPPEALHPSVLKVSAPDSVGAGRGQLGGAWHEF